jgi:hypothetical protein
MSDIKNLLARESEEAEERRERGGDDAPLYRSTRPPRDPAQVYSVRMPVERLGALRRVADERSMTPSALLRQWVLERLDQEEQAQGLEERVRRAVRDELERAGVGETMPAKRRGARSRSKPVALP